ncbi:MAG: IS21-like element helper ATPase IstB [bacterium]
MTTPVDEHELLEGFKRLKLRNMRDLLEADELEEELEGFEHPLEALNHLVQKEVSARDETRRQRRLTQAKFPDEKTLDGFEFGEQPSVDETEIQKLASLQFIEAAENVVFLGPPGIGKTHLAIALGVRAVNEGHSVRFITAEQLVDTLYQCLADGTLKRRLNKFNNHDLLIIDELGYLSMDQTASDHFFQVVNKAYETQSIILTSNRPFQEWSGLFDDATVVSAILDRLLHHVHLFNMEGDSYRLKDLKETNMTGGDT